MFKPTTQIDVAQGTPEWHEFRRGGIGGSEIAAIMGLDKYKTALDIQRDKLGLVRDPFTGNGRTELGTFLEPFVAAKYTERTGHKVRRQPCKIHDTCCWVRSSIDRQIVGTGRETPGILEIKTTNPWTFKQAKLEGLPATWILQLQHYLEVWGYSWGAYAVLDRESGDLMTFEVERDQEIGTAIVKTVAEWWQRHILDREPIEVEKPSDIELPEVGGEMAIMDGSAEWAAAAEALREAKDIVAQAAALEASAKAKILSIMGSADVAQGAGVRIYNREQAGRSSFDKKALQAAHPEIDLSQYEKRGKPFRVFKVYDVRGEVQ